MTLLILLAGGVHILTTGVICDVTIFTPLFLFHVMEERIWRKDSTTRWAQRHQRLLWTCFPFLWLQVRFEQQCRVWRKQSPSRFWFWGYTSTLTLLCVCLLTQNSNIPTVVSDLNSLTYNISLLVLITLQRLRNDDDNRRRNRDDRPEPGPDDDPKIDPEDEEKQSAVQAAEAWLKRPIQEPVTV